MQKSDPSCPCEPQTFKYIWCVEEQNQVIFAVWVLVIRHEPHLPSAFLSKHSFSLSLFISVLQPCEVERRPPVVI